MKDLLVNYSLSEIVLFFIFLVVAVKELISLIDWFRDRLKKVYDKDYSAKEEHEKLENEIEDISDGQKKVDTGLIEINRHFEKVDSFIEMLVESDKESIKAYITEKHHYFVYEKEWIDDYSMECLEKRFAVYQREHGNSFVKGLMNEIRSLPKQPPTEIEHKYSGTAEYIRNANN